MVGAQELLIQVEQCTHRCGREVSSTTSSSAGFSMLRFCLNQHAMEEMEVCMLGSWACMSPCSRRRLASGTCLYRIIPLAPGMHVQLPSPEGTQQRKAALLCCPGLLSCAGPRASLISPLRVLNISLMSKVVLASS